MVDEFWFCLGDIKLNFVKPKDRMFSYSLVRSIGFLYNAPRFHTFLTINPQCSCIWGNKFQCNCTCYPTRFSGDTQWLTLSMELFYTTCWNKSCHFHEGNRKVPDAGGLHQHLAFSLKRTRFLILQFLFNVHALRQRTENSNQHIKYTYILHSGALNYWIYKFIVDLSQAALRLDLSVSKTGHRNAACLCLFRIW